MVTRIRKWGNSLALRIPKAMAEGARLDAGSEVEIDREGGRLVVRPVRVRRFTLASLLRGIRPTHLHAEVDLGARVGRELI